MSKVKDSSEVPTRLISWAVGKEQASVLIDSNQAPAIQAPVDDEKIGEGSPLIQPAQRLAILSRRRSPEDFDEETRAKKAIAPNYAQAACADVPISVLKSDRDRSRTLRRARKRLRAARRMESRTQKQRVEGHKTVPGNRSKLLN